MTPLPAPCANLLALSSFFTEAEPGNKSLFLLYSCTPLLLSPVDVDGGVFPAEVTALVALLSGLLQAPPSKAA